MYIIFNDKKKLINGKAFQIIQFTVNNYFRATELRKEYTRHIHRKIYRIIKYEFVETPKKLTQFKQGDCITFIFK